MDEPWGRNDGSVAVPAAVEEGDEEKEKEKDKGETKRYFQCRPNFGVFVRPERVVVGDFEVLGGLEGEEGENELEEL